MQPSEASLKIIKKIYHCAVISVCLPLSFPSFMVRPSPWMPPDLNTKINQLILIREPFFLHYFLNKLAKKTVFPFFFPPKIS